MRGNLRYFYFLVPTLLLKCSAAIPVQTASEFVEENLRVRVRRQDGYVYDKPSVSFDLPQSSTPAPTQAPNVDRTLVQQMFYAYPVPAVGDTVNIGQTAGTTTTTAATAAPTSSGGSGYNYKPTATGKAGYNYGTPSIGAQVNTGSQVTSTGSQIAITGKQTASNTGTSQAGSGYGYNAPVPTLSPTLQGSSEVSTSAPKYLPPTSDGSTATGGSVNVGVSVTSGSGQVSTGTSTSGLNGSVGTPSDTYLPPLGTSNTATAGRRVTSTSISSQTNVGGSVSVPSSAYLPPITSSPTSLTSTSVAPQPAPAPPAGYIPPSGPTSGTVSAQASTYLPPSFF